MPNLVITGHEFPCRERQPAIAAMEFAADWNAGGSRQLASLLVFARACVMPEHHAALMDTLRALDDTDLNGHEVLDRAIGELMSEYVSGRPTERPSASSAGEPPTGDSLRVVSSSQDTAPAEPASSKGGRRAAS